MGSTLQMMETFHLNPFLVHQFLQHCTLLRIMTSFHQVLKMCCKGPRHLMLHPLPECHLQLLMTFLMHPNVVIEGDSQSTYLSILCQGKSLNVKCNRQLYNSANDTGFDNISWNEYLTKINILFPDILAASYVCEATYYKV